MSKQKQFSCVTRLRILFAVLTMAGVMASRPVNAQDTVEPSLNPVWSTSIAANSNPNGFDTPQIIAAIRNPHSDLVTLSAHRGIHALAGISQAKTYQRTL